MNIFKQVILILSFITQIAPVALADATFSKQEVPSREKVSSRARKVVSYTGAAVFGTTAIAATLASAYLLVVAGSSTIDSYKGNIKGTNNIIALAWVLSIAGGALGLGAGKLAQLCYKKACKASEEEKQK